MKHQPTYTEAKVALIDLENGPIMGAAWEMWDTDILWVEKDWYLFSYSVKWVGGRQITKTLADYPLFKRNFRDDSALVKDLWKVFDEADIIIAHNASAFDVKKANARFISKGLPPPSPYVVVDTLTAARRIAKFSSNKLDSVCERLGIGRKLPNTGKDLWRRCWNGEKAAFKEMARYNAHDVDPLLEGLYLYLRPWMQNHPNLRLFDKKPGCPSCGKTHVQKRGVARLASGKVKERLRCMECGKWFIGAIINE